jgi:hypothetical protein
MPARAVAIYHTAKPWQSSHLFTFTSKGFLILAGTLVDKARK